METSQDTLQERLRLLWDGGVYRSQVPDWDNLDSSFRASIQNMVQVVPLDTQELAESRWNANKSLHLPTWESLPTHYCEAVADIYQDARNRQNERDKDHERP